MLKYRPSTKPLYIIWLLLLLIMLILKYAFSYVQKFIPFSNMYILIPIWVAATFFAVFILPFYFKKAFFTVTSKAVTSFSGVIITSRQFMPLDSIMSVTIISFPFAKLFGFNFVILNSMGANLIIPFLKKSDAEELTASVNGAIRNRQKRQEVAQKHEI